MELVLAGVAVAAVEEVVPVAVAVAAAVSPFQLVVRTVVESESAVVEAAGAAFANAFAAGAVVVEYEIAAFDDADNIAACRRIVHK